MRQLLTVVFLFVAALAFGQVPGNITLSYDNADTDIIAEDLCWSYNGADSSVTRFTYVDPVDSSSTILYYLSQDGTIVDVTAGGTFEFGFCGCCDDAVIDTTAAFYKFVRFDSSYTLPLDTLIRYDIITISVQTSHTHPNNVITFPDIPDSVYNGKIIVLNMDSGSEVLDTVLVQVSGDSKLIQDDCYQAGRSEQDDLFLVDYDNPQTVIYHTAYSDDYYRQCEGLITLSDGSVVGPGDTLNIGSTDNKLYVQEGSSSLGVKGDRHFPYPTIQDALDDANSGDLIHVFPGEYTMTGYGDIFAQGEVYNFHFENGTKVSNAHFRDTSFATPQVITITGDATFYNNTNPLFHFSKGSYAYLEADTLTRSAIQTLVNSDQGGNYTLDVNYINAISGFTFFSPRDTSNSYITINANTVESVGDLIFANDVSGQNIVWNMGTYLHTDGLLHSNWKEPYNNTRIQFNINKYVDLDTSSSGAHPLLYWDSQSGRPIEHTNLQVNIKDVGITNDHLFFYLNAQEADSLTTSLNINLGNMTYVGDLSFVWGNRDNDFTQTFHMPINISCEDCKFLSGSLLESPFTGGYQISRLNFSGNYWSSSDSALITLKEAPTSYSKWVFDDFHATMENNLPVIRMINGVAAGSEFVFRNSSLGVNGDASPIEFSGGGGEIEVANLRYQDNETLDDITVKEWREEGEPQDTLMLTYPLLTYTGNAADTIADALGNGEYLDIISQSISNRRMVAFEITTTDTVSTDLYLQLYTEDIVAGTAAVPNPVSNFVLPQGTNAVRYDVTDTEIPAAGTQFDQGEMFYGVVTNGSAAGSSSYVATEGPNGIYITLYLIE